MSIENRCYQPESYSKEQLARWENGAKNFASFLKNSDQQADGHITKVAGPLQLMFLGEKPAIFHRLPMSDYGEKLKKFGFKLVDNYIYDPKQVAKIIEDYSEEFGRHNLSTPEEVMVFLDQAELKEYNVIRGLVLGFPYEAVKNFSKEDSFKINKIAEKLFELLEAKPEEQAYLELNYFTEKRAGNVDLIPFFKEELNKHKSELNISNQEITQLLIELQTQIEIKGFGAYGVSWTDSVTSKESANLEKRIKNAYEKSGILKFK